MRSASPASPRAFSLIESLVVIGIIGVLVSITVPALATARAAARQTVSLANVRTIGMTFNDYADHNGAYPYLEPGKRMPGMPMTPPPDAIAVAWWPPGAFIATNGPWGLAFLWPGVIADIAPWPDNFATWISPGRSTDLPKDALDALPGAEGHDVTVSYRYSNSFVAKPALWRPGAAPDRTLLGATKPADVRHPAEKVMLWDDDLAYRTDVPPRLDGLWNAPTPMVFADLHADARNPTQATAAVANVMNNNDSTRLHNTPDGVSGYDY